jgi:hypothetical protein
VTPSAASPQYLLAGLPITPIRGSIWSDYAFDPLQPAVTKSLCLSPESSRGRDAAGFIVIAMDVVAIILGIAAFAILLLMIEGIDRI